MAEFLTSTTGGRRKRRRRRRRRVAAVIVVLAAVGLATSGLVLRGSGRGAHAAAAVPTAGDPAVSVPSSAAAVPAVSVGPMTTAQPATSATSRAAMAEIRRLIAANVALREGSGKGRLVALTFDDGPGPYTAAVVRELRRLKAPATFFEIGFEISGYRRLVANMVRWGFVIGDHTWNHPQLTALSSALVTNEILSTKDLITKVTGAPPLFMRPPYGAQDARIRTLAGRLGLATTLWSIDTRDWSRPGVPAIVDSALQARPGMIILMHDGGGNRSETVAAIPAVVRGLRARGYHLVTLPQLLALAPPTGRR